MSNKRSDSSKVDLKTPDYSIKGKVNSNNTSSATIPKKIAAESKVNTRVSLK